MAPNFGEASSNGRTADFGSAHEGSNPSASATPAGRTGNLRSELRSAARPRQALIAVLGTVEAPLLSQVAAALRAVVGCEVTRLPGLDRPGYAFNKDRGQYHAAAILRRLVPLRAGKDGVPVVGITDADLFVPDAPFVFGDSDRSDLTAVVSVARMRGEPRVGQEQLLRRLSSEAVHELGHLLGLLHCQDARCAMFQSQRVSDLDRKQPGLCGTCRAAAGLAG